mmetsp:Transcript_15384/g.32152  ORF Transcript_15384/g.32152 Transcript_15384/m.32152 type:complete len:329 (-) Transcript_15384:260-1246(-)
MYNTRQTQGFTSSSARMMDTRGMRDVEHLGEVERDLRCRVNLEKTVIEQRAASLQRQALKLARQRAFLREERKRARKEEKQINDDKEKLEHVKKTDWFPHKYLQGAGAPSERVRMRVGGQMFEVSKAVLCLDPNSLLAALCNDESPLEVDREDQVVVVDRDWWLFRYIVIFLRDGLVPEDRPTALQLYREAAFWRLETLQRAIEEAHLDLTRTSITVDRDGTVKEKKWNDTTDGTGDKFWKNKPNWWESQAKKEKDEKIKTPEWWCEWSEIKAKDNKNNGLPSYVAKYNGKTFAPMSVKEKAVTTGKKDKDVQEMLMSTWGYSNQSRF